MASTCYLWGCCGECTECGPNSTENQTPSLSPAACSQLYKPSNLVLVREQLSTVVPVAGVMQLPGALTEPTNWHPDSQIAFWLVSHVAIL